MKKISLVALLIIACCSFSVLNAEPPQQPQPKKEAHRFRRPIIINIRGINIEIGNKQNGRRIRVDIPQRGVHVDVNTNQARNNHGGVHVMKRGIVYWGAGKIPAAPVPPPMPQSAPQSKIKLGQPTESGQPFELKQPVKQKLDSSVPPAPAIN